MVKTRCKVLFITAAAALGALLAAPARADGPAERLTALRSVFDAVQETLSFGPYCVDGLDFDYTLESAQGTAAELEAAAADPATMTALGKRWGGVYRAARKYSRMVAKTRTKVLFSGFDDDRRRAHMARAVLKGAAFVRAVEKAGLVLELVLPAGDILVEELNPPGSGWYVQPQTISVRVTIAPEVLQEGPVSIVSSYNRFRILADASVKTIVVPQNPSASSPFQQTYVYTFAEQRGVARFRVQAPLRAMHAVVAYNTADGSLPSID